MDSLKDIETRLLRLDEDADLLFEDDGRFTCILVGGSALILLGYITRATHDIDVLKTPAELLALLSKYDMNNNVSAQIDNFPDDYLERVHKLNLPTHKIDFYTLSLEDLVVSKLAAGRDKDLADITTKKVLAELNWTQLEECAEQVKLGMLSDRAVQEFEISYQEFVRWHRP